MPSGMYIKPSVYGVDADAAAGAFAAGVAAVLAAGAAVVLVFTSPVLLLSMAAAYPSLYASILIKSSYAFSAALNDPPKMVHRSTSDQAHTCVEAEHKYFFVGQGIHFFCLAQIFAY